MTSSTVEPHVSFRATLETYPSIHPFALDFVRNREEARRFLCRPELSTIVPRNAPRGSDALAAALIDSNRSWGNDVSRSVKSWRSGTSIALIAGQQVGFGGGPLYTLVKIASLLKLKKEFRARGIEASVFFWMATEDHDFDEVATLHLWSRDGLRDIRADRRPRVHSPVGSLEVPESLVEKLHEQCPDLSDDWLQRGINFRDSFAKLLAEVFDGEEIILVDALLPELRRDAREVIRRLIVDYDLAQRELVQRSRDLEAAGYKAQVEPSESGDYSLLFHIDENNERLPLRVVDGKGLIGDSITVELDRLLGLLDEHPERFSTGALTRPLVQDAALQPELFIGGPAEVAYCAQNAPLYELFGITAARVGLRGHLLVSPERYLRVMISEKITPGELFSSADEIAAKREHVSVSELEQRVASTRNAVARDLAALKESISTDERGLTRSIDRSRKRIDYHLERIAVRSKAAIARRDRERHSALERLTGTLAPGGVPQDRVAAWLSFWLIYGRNLIDRIVEEVEPDHDCWKVIGV